MTLGTVVMPTGAFSLCIRHGGQDKLNAGGKFLLEAIEPVRKRSTGTVLSREGIR